MQKTLIRSESDNFPTGPEARLAELLGARDVLERGLKRVDVLDFIDIKIRERDLDRYFSMTRIRPREERATALRELAIDIQNLGAEGVEALREFLS